MKNAPLTSLYLAFAIVLMAVPAAMAAENGGRFTMTPTDDGFLRLDSQTGAVALCGRAANGWSCKPVEDDQLAMQEKVASLNKENTELKKEVEDLRKALDTQFAEGSSPDAKKPGLRIPSDEEIDRFMGFLEKMARKFKGMVKELKENQEPGTPL